MSAPSPRNSARAETRTTTALGRRAERRARWFYRLRGYRVLAVNARAGGNELDVIARRGRRLVFCEVKAKGGERYGAPLAMVGAEKQRRLRRAAESWLAAHPELAELEIHFEVVALRGRSLTRVADALA